ncbi:MAG TPA: hypothetical protein PLH92_15760 [Mycobacterium sp.]|nr:hypothetical protein [Mycobacterium sp.]HQC78166.1 hypothetical protein [Mycobacterium sp.]
MPAADFSVVKRAGRTAALQASAALAALLLLVGAAFAVADVRAQTREITDHLAAVAETADDAGDPPPGMELVLRDTDGHVSTSRGGKAGVPLLAGPAGFTELQTGGRTFRALVVDRPVGRVVALIDMAPIQADQRRLWAALAFRRTRRVPWSRGRRRVRRASLDAPPGPGVSAAATIRCRCLT